LRVAHAAARIATSFYFALHRIEEA
jgi:hypothetical protein